MLETRDLAKRFGGVRAVDRVNLSVPAGDLRALVGPNGAGKTTLFNLITGEVRRDAGSIRFEGSEIAALPPHQICRRGIGRAFQVTSVFRGRSVLENVQTALLTHRRRHRSLFGSARGVYRDEALAALERVGLAPRPRDLPATLPMATSGAWSWPSPWPATRDCSCSMSRRPGWRRASGIRPSTSWPASRATRG